MFHQTNTLTTGTDAVEKRGVVAKMMKAWEAKATKRAANATGFTLMAVSLAACNDDAVSPANDDAVSPANDDAVSPANVTGDLPSTTPVVTSEDQRFFVMDFPTQTVDENTVNGVDVNLALEMFAELAGVQLAEGGLSIENLNVVQEGLTSSDDNTTSTTANQGTNDNTTITTANQGTNTITIGAAGDTLTFADFVALVANNEIVTVGRVILTPEQNSGIVYTVGQAVGDQFNPEGSGFGTLGNPSDGDDMIFFTRTELLHAAIVDGGDGNDTLRIEAKGPYAQPTAVVSIETIEILNSANTTVDILNQVNGNAFDATTFQTARSTYIETSVADTWIDLSAAFDIENLVISENNDAGGNLFVVGVNNAAHLTLQDGFLNDVNISYGFNGGSVFNVTLEDVNFEGADLNVVQNSSHVAIESTGVAATAENYLDNGDFGANLRKLTVTGDKELHIDAAVVFNTNRAIEIDASANTAGVHLTTTNNGSGANDFDRDAIVVKGSQGNDDFTLSADHINITSTSGTNRYDLTGTGSTVSKVVVSGGAANNTIYLNGVTLAEGSAFTGTGSNTLVVADGADLTSADISGVDAVVLQGTVTISLAQAEAIGDGSISTEFGAETRGKQTILIEGQGTVDATDLLALTSLTASADLGVALDDDAVLEITQAELEDLAIIKAQAGTTGSVVRVASLDADELVDVGADIQKAGAGAAVEEVVLVLEDDFTAESGFDVTNGSATIEASGTVDLSAAGTLAGVDQVIFSGADATVTLSAAQINSIIALAGSAEDAFVLANGATGATLNVTDLDGAAIDLDAIADLGINIGSVSTVDATFVLNATTTLGQADSFTITMDNLNVTVTMTARQLEQIAGGVSELDTDTTGAPNTASLTVTDLEEIAVDGVLANLDYTRVDLSGDMKFDVDTASGAIDLEFAATVDLGGFEFDADGGTGLTLRFNNVEQADGRVIGSVAAETNVVWLFEELGAGVQIDTIDYTGITRLWISEALVEDAGGNVEELYTVVRDAIIVRIYNDADLLDLSGPINRIAEIEAFTTIDGNLTFSDLDANVPFENLESLTLTLGGNVTIGNIVLDDVLDADAVILNEFNGLTIVSNAASDADSILLPDDFDEDLNPLPGSLPIPANTIGNISSNLGGLDLLNVTIDSAPIDGDNAAAATVIDTVTFNSDGLTAAGVAGNDTATFIVDGAGNVTVEAINANDADITTLNISTLGAGNLTITGASPAIEADGVEELTVTATNAASEITFGTSDDAEKPGIESDALATLTVTGAGDIDLGVITSVNGDEFTLQATAFNNGDLSVTFDGVAMNADSTFTIDGTGAILFDVTITGNTTFGADAALTITDAKIIIDGAVDLSDATLVTAGTVTFEVAAGDTLTLTAAQADGATITGAGSVVITALEDTLDADFLGIMTAAGDTGTVSVTLDSTGDVTLLNGADLGLAALNIIGNGAADVTAAVIQPLTRTAGDVNPSITVGADASLSINPDQLGDVSLDWNTTVIGAGDVSVTDLGASAAMLDADLSGVAVTGSFDAAFDIGGIFTGNFGDATVTVANTVTVTTDMTFADGATIVFDPTPGNRDGAIILTSGAAVDADLSNITLRLITVDPTAVLGDVTFPVLDTPELEDGNGNDVEYAQTVVLTQVQANGQTITGVGVVTIDVDETDTAAFDLSDIAVLDTAGDSSVTVVVDANYTLHGNTDLGSANVTVATGDVLTGTAAQLSGVSVTGLGAVTATALGTAAVDLSGLATSAEIAVLAAVADLTLDVTTDLGTVVIETGAVNETLTLTAAQADGRNLDEAVAGLTDITVTSLEDGSAIDITSLIADGNDAYDIDVELDSTGNVEIARGANFEGLNTTGQITISGNGIVTIADTLGGDAGADVDTTDFVVGADATLVADRTHVDSDAVVTIANVTGEGTLEVIVANADTITITDDVRFTNVVFEGVEAGVTINGFAPVGVLNGGFLYTTDVIGRQAIELNGDLVVVGAAPLDADGFVSVGIAATLADGVTVINNVVAGNSAVSLAVTDVETYLADITGGGVAAIAFADDDDVAYVVVSDGTDTAIFLVEDADSDLAIDDTDLTLIAILDGVSDTSTLTAANFTGFA